MVNHTTSTWDSSDITLLQLMWSAGNSASVIADAMHRSRNAVVGKVKRMNLHRENKQPIIAKTPAAARPKAPTVREPAKPPPEPAQPVPYLQAQSFHCRAVLDVRGDDGLVMRCGGRRLADSPWCYQHQLEYHGHRGP